MKIILASASGISSLLDVNDTHLVSCPGNHDCLTKMRVSLSLQHV